MRKFINLFLSLFLVFVPLFGSVQAQAESSLDTSYMIVIDASGSMDGNDRMERAKSSAENFLNGIKGLNVEAGLMVFYDCGDIRVLHELTTDIDALIQPLRQIQPSGLTPLAGSIAFGANYLHQNGLGDKGKLIAYTDGMDTCGGSYPEARDAIEGLEIDIWGIDLSPEDERAIEEGLGQDVKDMDEPPVELSRILVDPFPENFYVGQSIQVHVKGEWSDGSIQAIPPNEVQYKSSREDIAVISNTGQMTALARGSSYIDFTYQGQTLRTTVTVKPAPTLDRLFVDPFPENVMAGEVFQLQLKGEWSDGSVKTISPDEINYKSSREDRIVISDDGQMTALASGSSYVEFEYGNKKLRIVVTIKRAPTLTDFYLDSTLPSTLVLGDVYTISGLKAKWSDGSVIDVPVTDVTVSSSRPDRVQVKNGELEAVASGLTSITLEYKGKTIRSSVKVTTGKTLTNFYLDSALPSSLTIGDTYTISGLKAKWSDGSVTDVPVTDVTVSSSRSDRIKVTNGELEAVALGSSYIYLEYGGKTIQSTVKATR
ncbi:VWA domain-containing protein [Niallia endozanthoxylica]|uniref:VWA domain-containing protein n=1 Tax=Niallia endozanthoxylica TaxID=2036016 RepID=A0A5J5HMH9_9BACI|nr:VWA domain-containing protein [Niallia endozanthoxylica]KAA9022048.1 VWA domain-containing protein [Niallia endozanthoxylica]